MRHPVPDPKTQQQQQQNFLASMQHQLAIKEKVPIGSTAVIPSTTDLTMAGIDKTTFVNCLNGFQLKPTHPQQQPRIIMKDATMRTINPVMFNPTTQTMHHQTTTSIATSSNIQSEFCVDGNLKIFIHFQ